MEIVSKLQNYAQLEGTELGEACSLLCRLYNYSPYLGESFNKSLLDEIRGQLHNFVAHSKIVTRVETTKLNIQELEWDE